jgi:hypothetical protein
VELVSERYNAEPICRSCMDKPLIPILDLRNQFQFDITSSLRSTSLSESNPKSYLERLLDGACPHYLEAKRDFKDTQEEFLMRITGHPIRLGNLRDQIATLDMLCPAPEDIKGKNQALLMLKLQHLSHVLHDEGSIQAAEKYTISHFRKFNTQDTQVKYEAFKKIIAEKNNYPSIDDDALEALLQTYHTPIDSFKLAIDKFEELDSNRESEDLDSNRVELDSNSDSFMTVLYRFILTCNRQII